MSRPLVSFVIPCYNYGRFVGECIQSILKQEQYADFEIIAINDASTDNTEQVISNIVDPRITFLQHKTNQGHVITINEGLKLARGYYVNRIDADDRLKPFYLKETIPVFEKFPSVGMVYGPVTMIDAEGRPSPESTETSPVDVRENGYLRLLYGNFISAPTVLARKEAWERALPIPQGYSHSDWYLNIGIARHYEIYYRAKPLADYRVHGANHHSIIARTNQEEETSFRILDIFFNSVEADARAEWAKQQQKKRILAANYALYAIKHVGNGLNDDFRRCFKEALSLDPRLALDRRLMRSAAGSLLNRRVKRLIRKVI